MFDKIKKKFNKPEILTKIFYGVAGIVVLERLIALCLILSGKNMLMTSKEMFFGGLFWYAEEYSLAFLLPVAGFAYFCSSKYASNTENKVKMYFVTYVLLAGIAFIMLAQWSNEAILYVLRKIENGNLLRLLSNSEEGMKIFLDTLKYATLYVPACVIAITPTSVPLVLDSEHSLGKLKGLSLISSKVNPEAVGEMTCEVRLCDDLNSGAPVMISEARRMETVLVQGATGTGKTSTMLLPMCASDLEKKYFFREKAKELGYKALTSGCAYVNAPYDNETLNNCFSLNFLRPIFGREKEFMEILKPMIKGINEETNEIIFKDLGITVLEPDGNFIDDFRLVADNLGIMVYKIDPLDPNSYGINPFINKSPAKVASIISTVLKGMYESENPDSSNVFFGQVTQQALENLAILLKLMYPKMHDGLMPTLEDMLECLYNYDVVEEMCEELKLDPVLSVKHAILIKYFEKNFYKPPLDINGKPILGTVGSNRKETELFLYGATTQLDNLMRNKKVRRILCSRDNNIDLDKVLSQGCCVSVCTRRGELGALLAKPFGMFYILTMQDAVLRRPGDEDTRVPHFMYIDEFPDFVNKETETCFTLFRKYRCGMTIAIQNLSQLERTESMKFYKQVITSNSRTVAVFGDTNKEDSEYWSKAFGRYEYWDMSSSSSTKPLANVKKEEAATEKFGVGFEFTENIKPYQLNEMPFRTLYYRTRDAKGTQIFGNGTTDFLDKKYLKRYSMKEYDFEHYANYNPNDPGVIREAPVIRSIIDQEIEMNDAIEGRVSEDIEKLMLSERQSMQQMAKNSDIMSKVSTSDEIEYIDDIEVEIDKKL